MKWNPVSRAAIAIAFAGLCAAAGGAPNGLGVDALDDFARENPAARLYQTNGLITSVYGPAFSHGATAEASVNTFLANHADMFGVRPQDLVPRSLGSAPSNAIPIMPDFQTGVPRFTLYTYGQTYDGLEVFSGEIRLLVRNEENSPLVLARSGLRPIDGFQVDRAALNDLNTDMAHALALTRDPSLRVFSDPRPVIFAGTESRDSAPRLAFVFDADSGDPLAQNYSAWRYVADAATGEILHEEPMILHADVSGSVQGNATQGPGADFCHPEAATGMPYARVNIGGNAVFADVNGDYVLTGVADGAVSVTASLSNGQFFRVAGGVTQSVNGTAPDSVDFLFNATPSEFTNSEVNVYLAGNIQRDWVLVRSPAYPLEVSGGMQLTVNVAGSCNAGYNPPTQSISFFRAGGGCPNAGFASVMYHEYGHHLVSSAGSGQGQYGEGMGDCMSLLISDDPILGRGWSGGNCNGGLRTAVNTYQYPCSGEVHDCGNLISGAVWDTRNALFATNPSDYLEILSTLVVNSILLHNGSSITPQITIDLLTLDDDDSDILNGTPHYNQIDEGFSLHNMAAPELNLLSFNYPDGIPEAINPNGTTTLSVLVGNVGGSLTPGSIEVLADLDNNGTFETLSGSVQSSGPEGVLYTASFPGGDCGAPVRFYTQAESSGILVTSPADAPQTTFLGVVASSIEVTFEDDFESDTGWTVGAAGDNATTGIWTRGDPNGTDAQPEDDYDLDGAQCFFTGQAAPGATIGDNDVDGGTTTLLSPILDGSADGAKVSYARWYSNDQGGAPNADTFLIDISNDGGSSWTPLETVGPVGPETGGGWVYKTFVIADVVSPTDQIRLRFRASDLGSGSIVEAAVDAVTVDNAVCLISCPGDIDGNQVVGFEDLNLLLDNYGQTGMGLDGDFDGDGDVDFEDLNALLDNFGQSCL